MNKILAFFLLLMLGASCVTNKQLIYLQGDFDEDKDDLPYNTVIKEVALDTVQYRLLPEDVLSVKIFSITPSEFNFIDDADEKVKSQDPLLAGYVINSMGFIDLPVLGIVYVEGLTIEDATNKIKEVAAKFLISPTINVKILSFHYTILGEVTRPGQYNTYRQKVTLFQSLGMAGDITQYGNKMSVKIVRHEGGVIKVTYVNLLDDSFLESPYYYLKPNDLVIVNPMKIKNFKQYGLANYGVMLSTVTAISLTIFYFTR